MTIEYVVLVSVPFGNGKLVALNRHSKPLNYYASPPFSEIGDIVVKHYKGVEEKNGKTIKNILELKKLIQKLKVNLLKSISKNEVSYATIFMYLLGIRGRPIKTGEFFEHIEEEYKIKLSDHMPRIIGNLFCFLVSRFTLDNLQAALWNISINLEEMTWTKEEIYHV